MPQEEFLNTGWWVIPDNDGISSTKGVLSFFSGLNFRRRLDFRPRTHFSSDAFAQQRQEKNFPA